MSSLEEIIEEYRQVVEDKIVSAETAKKKFDQLIELQKIKKGRLNGERLSEDDVQRALNLLCYNDFAGCCDPSKGCPWNNAVSDALGIDYEKLYEEKRETVRKYLNLYPSKDKLSPTIERT